MSRILYIGDYYPMFSYKAKLNSIVAESIRNKGHEVILMSKSWCKVNKDNFYGTVEELSNNYPFSKKYFIDPIQVMDSKLELNNAYLGLGCKIIEKEYIEQIIFADNIIYAPAIIMLKNQYSIPCTYLFFDGESFRCAMDDYVWPYMQMIIKAFDKILSYPNYSEIWKKLFKIDETKMFFSSPIQYTAKHSSAINEEKIYLLCEDNSNENLIKLLKGIKSKIGTVKREILIVSQTNVLQERVCIGKAKYEKIFIKRIPEYSLILGENELLRGYSLDISYILTILACNQIPMVNRSHYEELKDYDVQYKRIGKFFAVYDMKINCKRIEEFFC